MAKIIKRTKKDGSCSYCIRVSNGYDRQGRQVLVNRTFTPPPGVARCSQHPRQNAPGGASR